MSVLSIQQIEFGEHQSKTVYQYVLQNSDGMQVTVLNYGGIIQSLLYPDTHGETQEMVLGMPTLTDYVEDAHYLGALVGRFANRIANGCYSIDGKVHQVEQNTPPHHLHGGAQGLHNCVWKAYTQQNRDSVSLVLSTLLVDGTSGYPGDVIVNAIYTLDNDNTLSIDLRAVSTELTPINLTSHPYFCLGAKGDMLDATLKINASHYTPSDDTLIPTGEITPVDNTPFDFRKPIAIGKRLDLDHLQIKQTGGYDHNFVINNPCQDLSQPVCTLGNPQVGIEMDIFSDHPGLQFYSGNAIHDSGVENAVQFGGICLEPQHFPDAPNKPHFPSAWLQPGQTYRHQIRFAFRHINISSE